ncbi:kinase-like domain-containing protein [Dunaliella salina]|uniref:Kinase-like domain-containing protein n=1 Tax=Dunaliella salina TaxID=3046 RepID=A0ABQ7FX26_DUNSA|nr:kinase-like domain-containing protein [Dunaliella salina]|eukprot:KAF5826901.1 kinase-like domain-containing protein [Dunaliella salina]
MLVSQPSPSHSPPTPHSSSSPLSCGGTLRMQPAASSFAANPNPNPQSSTQAPATQQLQQQQQHLQPSFMSRRRPNKREIALLYCAKLAERGDFNVSEPGFQEDMIRHFETLPTRYALDVNLDSLDVLSHQRLLNEARADQTSVSYAVRPVEILVQRSASSGQHPTQGCDMASSPQGHRNQRRGGMLPKPAFGSSPNLQALALEAAYEKEAGHTGGDSAMEENNSGVEAQGLGGCSTEAKVFYEITVASVDQPKLLSRLSEALSDLGLNIREAHAFNTTDRFSMDVFVVDVFHLEPGTVIEDLLGQRLARMPPPQAFQHPSGQQSQLAQLPPQQQQKQQQQPPAAPLQTPPDPHPMSHLQGPPVRPASPVVDDWEIDITQLQIDAKVASGAFSNLYRGSYCGQEVAVKILKDVQDDTSQYQEFLQEVSIMRKVRHKNMVQFIGACTRKPNLCIVFEFMAGGSVYDYIRRVSVARIIGTGNMTAETGTYRWMAPEVIEHKPYGEKADIFSFAVVIWELLTCKVPYSDMTPLQAAVGVVQKGLRPGIPPNCPPVLAELMSAAWDQNPAARPSFRELTPRLAAMLEAAKEEEARMSAMANVQKASTSSNSGGLLAKLRGTVHK